MAGTTGTSAGKGQSRQRGRGAAAAPAITAFCCHKALYAGLGADELARAHVDGVRIVETPCSGKVDVLYLLKAFEKGADAVVVVACDQRLCSTIEGARRIHKRVARAQALLAEAGIEPERLVLRIVRRPALRNLAPLFARVRETIIEKGPSPVR